jgi:hypothetical protein
MRQYDLKTDLDEIKIQLLEWIDLQITKNPPFPPCCLSRE